MVKRVRKLSLKPGQKLELLTKYIFPRYIYHLFVSPPSDTVLKLLDSEGRQEIKTILHLMPSTATGFFYTPKACGGLGIPRFEHIIKLGTLKNAIMIANRSTLILKINKPTSLVENWRPITIGPVLGRIFSSILDGRIRRDIVFNLRQRGFTSESGCKINIDLLNAVLSYSKRDNGGIFTIVDISKVFETILHSALKPCLARKGVPTPIIDLVYNTYDGSKMQIKSKGNIMIEIQILRGVKQPLSPLLFNLCLELLLETIEEQTS